LENGYSHQVIIWNQNVSSKYNKYQSWTGMGIKHQVQLWHWFIDLRKLYNKFKEPYPPALVNSTDIVCQNMVNGTKLTYIIVLHLCWRNTKSFSTLVSYHFHCYPKMKAIFGSFNRFEGESSFTKFCNQLGYYYVTANKDDFSHLLCVMC
jgi:hypothetical protein